MKMSDETKALLGKRGVYAIANTVDGKRTTYVGSTADSFKSRLKNHQSRLNRGISSLTHLQRAWVKYGEDAFEFIVLQIDDRPEAILSEEQLWLDHFRSIGGVYNIGAIAKNPRLGQTNSFEAREKVSRALKGRPLTLETRRKLSKAHIGLKQSPECIAKRVEKIRGRKRILAPQTREAQLRVVSKPYPSFYNTVTGEIIPTGTNLTGMCRQHGINERALRRLMLGHSTTGKTHDGWTVTR